MFCIGQVWFSRSAIILVLLFGVLLGLRAFANAAATFRVALAELSPTSVPVMVIATVLMVTAIAGLALPTGDMNDDSIAYHYLGPKVWLRDGVIRPVPDEMQTSFPSIVESQYAALMLLGGQRAPGFFAVTSVICILLITASLALRLGLGASGAWWAAALIITMGALYRGAYGGFVDVLYAGFVLAAARFAFDADAPGHYSLFGAFGGFAASLVILLLLAVDFPLGSFLLVQPDCLHLSRLGQGIQRL